MSKEVKTWAELNQLEQRKRMVEELLKSVREDAEKTMEGFAFFIFFRDDVRIIEAGRIHIPTILGEIMKLIETNAE
jgi:hypothetical protein